MKQLALISNPSLNQQIAVAVIRGMLAGRFFNVTPVRDAATVMGKELGPDASAKITALHCLDFSLLTPDIKDFIVELCNGIVKE